METFWLHARSDMSEVNDSMVCKYIPKKRKPKQHDTVSNMSKQSELDTIPESDSCVTPERHNTTISESLQGVSNVSDGMKNFAKLNKTSSLDSVYKPDTIIDQSAFDASSITTSESDTKAVFDDGYSAEFRSSDAESNGKRRSIERISSTAYAEFNAKRHSIDTFQTVYNNSTDSAGTIAADVLYSDAVLNEKRPSVDTCSSAVYKDSTGSAQTQRSSTSVTLDLPEYRENDNFKELL